MAIVAVGLFPLSEGLRVVVTRPDVTLYGDQALTALAARRAAGFDQLLGPYSRTGFHHLGPAVFYLLAPFVNLFGSPGAGIYLGASAVNLVALTATVAVLWRRAGPFAALWAAGAIDLYCLFLGPGTLREPWNPYLVIAPMILFVVVQAAGAAGSRPCTVWALVVGSYEVQTHVATAAVVLTLVVATGYAVVRRRRTGTPALAHGRVERATVVAGWVALGALWVAPVVELVGDHPDNLQLLWRFFTGGHPAADLGQVLRMAGDAITVVPFGNHDYTLALHHDTFGVVIVVCGLVAASAFTTRLARRTGCTLRRGLVRGGVLVATIGTLSLAGSDGPVYMYFALWLSVVPVVLLLALGVALADAPSTRSSWSGLTLAHRPGVLPLLLAATALLGAGTTVADLTLPSPAATIGSGPWPAADAGSTQGRLRTVRDTVVLDRASVTDLAGRTGVVVLRIGAPSLWPYAAGVALALDERGIGAMVEPSSWQTYFGPEPSPATDAPVLALVPSGDGAARAVEGRLVLARIDGVVLTVGRDVGTTSNSIDVGQSRSSSRP